MSQFVHQREPEVVYAVIPQRESDHWGSSANEYRGSVKVCATKMTLNNNVNAVTAKII